MKSVNHFSRHDMGLSELLTLSSRSYSTSGAVLTTEVFELSFSVLMLPPSLVSPSSPFDNHLYPHSLQGLVTNDLPDNFLQLLIDFLAVVSNFTKSL